MQFFLEATQGAGMGGIGTIVMLVVLVVVFYFLLIRPQKKKEKEEAKKREAAEAAQRENQPAAAQSRPKDQGVTAVSKGEWYFYNPNTLKQGIKEFQKRWGKRANEDNWRYSSKEGLPESASVAQDSTVTEEEKKPEEVKADETRHQEDSIAEAEALKDSLAKDPHHREYYMLQIPFTEEQLAASNDALSKALYQAGILEQERLVEELFENDELVKPFLEHIHENKPRYYRDQLGVIRRLFEEWNAEAVKRGLKYCTEKELYSASDLKSSIIYLEQVLSEKNEENFIHNITCLCITELICI